jgi:hypothetical protein
VFRQPIGSGVGLHLLTCYRLYRYSQSNVNGDLMDLIRNDTTTLHFKMVQFKKGKIYLRSL